MSLSVVEYVSMSTCFPRVSGDEPPAEHMKIDVLMFSSRERG